MLWTFLACLLFCLPPAGAGSPIKSASFFFRASNLATSSVTTAFSAFLALSSLTRFPWAATSSVSFCISSGFPDDALEWYWKIKCLYSLMAYFGPKFLEWPTQDLKESMPSKLYSPLRHSSAELVSLQISSSVPEF